MLWLTNRVMAFEDRVEKRISNAYQLALQNAWYDRVMSDRVGKGRKDHFEWLLTTAQIYELAKGEMRYDDLITQAHYVEHKRFGVGLRIDREQWEDDEVGFASDWMDQAGAAMAMEPQYQAISLLTGGESNLGYDGVAFFHASHPVHPGDSTKGTYRNLFTTDGQLLGTGATNAPALSTTLFPLAVAKMKQFKMPNGKNRNLKPDLLIVGPTLEKTAREVLFAGYINATDNILKDYQIDLLVINEITDNSWYLQASNGETPGLLPFVRSIRREFQMTSYDGLTQAELNRMDELEWLIKGRYAYTYGHPYQMIKVKVS